MNASIILISASSIAPPKYPDIVPISNPGLKEKQVRQIEKISDYYNLLSRIDMMKLEMCSSDLLNITFLHFLDYL